MRVLTFATSFPSTHPRKGEPTYFVEKILNSINHKYEVSAYEVDKLLGFSLLDQFGIKLLPKHHTIRADRKDGKKWKAGDYFSPRVWSGRPRVSKQIVIAPPIKVEKVWDINIYPTYDVWINDETLLRIGSEDWETLATNDGLNGKDLTDWFIPNPKKFKGFSGQIICWNNEINY